MKNLLTLAHSLNSFVVGTEGNVSAKYKNGFLIKSSGTQLKTLGNKDLTFCDKTGNQINSTDKKPSMEVYFHSWLLQEQNISVVAHTHPTNTVKILCTYWVKEFATKRLFPDQVVFNGAKSCIVPYALPGEDLVAAIIKSVSKFKQTEQYFPKLILLQNHGIICCGSSYKECLVATEICEKAAEIFIGAKALGKPKYLSITDTANIIKDKHEEYRKKILL